MRRKWKQKKVFEWVKPGLFYLNSLFPHCKDKNSTNLTINDKSIDGVLGTKTRGSRIKGADKSTELWQHPKETEKFKLGSVT